MATNGCLVSQVNHWQTRSTFRSYVRTLTEFSIDYSVMCACVVQLHTSDVRLLYCNFRKDHWTYGVIWNWSRRSLVGFLSICLFLVDLSHVDHGVMVVFFTLGACLLPCSHLLQAVKSVVNQCIYFLRHHVRSIMEKHVSNEPCANKNRSHTRCIAAFGFLSDVKHQSDII